MSVDIIDRWDHGFGWSAGEDDPIYRTSHALVDDGDVWLVDPVDFPDLDATVAEYGTVRGAVVLLDRHKRDAAPIADRHDVPVLLPEALAPIRDAFDAPVEVFGDDGGPTGYRSIPVMANRFWREVALYDDPSGTLVVPEALVTAPAMCVNEERLAVHPVLRPIPPRSQFGGLTPSRILVGHGPGIHADASTALATALARARVNMPRAYWKLLVNSISR